MSIMNKELFILMFIIGIILGVLYVIGLVVTAVTTGVNLGLEYFLSGVDYILEVIANFFIP
ncbi:hypothetical protein [Dethiobacter alkaliphilus]|uniref:hypothetical protein n=1 Tax=Dethiobacter alkaliphilus TaxID=427926 RepID=UPI0022274C46|nr:hypothetical protein [Dethiobacter alkaliphilus]MCW3488667.1 hypothetical protein [Dethiobacter alkaliphilus]